MNARRYGVGGFTLLELLVAMGVFLVICAAMFELLELSQKKYSSETQLTSAFSDARLAVDQIVRDIGVAGYPPVSIYTGPPPTPYTQFAISPVAWSPNYPNTQCTIISGGGGTCTTPGDFDLILETRLAGDSNVSWVWYHLDPTKFTLYREVVQKTAGDPLAVVSSAGTMTALLDNVMNNPGSQLTQIKANYPAMFPSGGAQPIFQYSCGAPLPCPSNKITDVDITLIVKTPQQDMQTQRMQLVELSGRGHVVNSIM
jgi:prepilin-type N-terminal cleavage/methylation domain-containing protein